MYTNPAQQHVAPKMPNYFQQTEVTRKCALQPIADVRIVIFLEGPTKEISLYNTGSAKEKEFYDNLAELYAIFKTTEALEKAQLREAMPFEE